MRPNTTVKFLYPIIPSGINPSIGIGPTQGQKKTLTRVGFEGERAGAGRGYVRGFLLIFCVILIYGSVPSCYE